MLDGPSSTGAVVSAPSFHHLSDTTRIFQQGAYQTPGVVSPFAQHLGYPGVSLQQQHPGHGPSGGQQQPPSHVATQIGQSPGCVFPQVSPGLANASQSLAALFASTPLISDDLKLAAAAAAAAAAASQSHGKKKLHRVEPVPQSGFKGVSWNSRMKAWLAFYVTENGERKSKTFSTRKLGMEEARLQAIAFCKQKQEQRREARKRSRGLQNQHCGAGSVVGESTGSFDKLSSDESIIGSPTTAASNDYNDAQQQHSAMRCGYPTTPGMSNNITSAMMATPTTGSASQTSNSSEIAYVPIVPIAIDMIEKSGLLQPLELNVLPPCQHCNKQPYPFLMIVSEGQEQTYSGSSIMSLASHNVSSAAPASPSDGHSANAGPSAPNGLSQENSSRSPGGSSDGIESQSSSASNGMFFNV